MAQAAQTYQVYILDAIGAVVCVKEVVPQRITSDQWIAVLFSLQAWDIELLSPNEKYYISIESQNQAGRRNSTGTLHLCTSKGPQWSDSIPTPRKLYRSIVYRSVSSHIHKQDYLIYLSHVQRAIKGIHMHKYLNGIFIATMSL